MQTNYKLDSTKYTLGQIAQTALQHIDSFQLVNIDVNTRSYARFGDVVIRAVADANLSTDQIALRANAAAQQTTALMIGIVVRDNSYGHDVYQSKLAVDNDNDNGYIKRNLINVLRKGRIAVQVGVDVSAGDPAFPNQIGANFDTLNIKYYRTAQNNSERIGTFVTSATNGSLAILEIDCVN